GSPPRPASFVSPCLAPGTAARGSSTPSHPGARTARRRSWIPWKSMLERFGGRASGHPGRLADDGGAPDLLLELHETLEQRLGSRRASGDVHVDGDAAVDALH